MASSVAWWAHLWASWVFLRSRGGMRQAVAKQGNRFGMPMFCACFQVGVECVRRSAGWCRDVERWCVDSKSKIGDQDTERRWMAQGRRRRQGDDVSAATHASLPELFHAQIPTLGRHAILLYGRPVLLSTHACRLC
ncbi:hypothetical protein K491DRAFT_341906 [Lophiostoma macrostomum CBS 122681]|uniref:Secreted protein n=1 Tax=Lophiostoma macrostomum CBS 122681 TaxID=1314788 RepID=A0A6A6TEA6_9PLEO|nr:hypothetical protein K491DRAFT_341906 [Lophiostoma macrostomum CBS 122681]